MKRKFMHNLYVVALKIVIQEARARRSLKPLTLLWKTVTYGEYPYIVHGTLTEYIKFCRVNRIVVSIPESELA